MRGIGEVQSPPGTSVEAKTAALAQAMPLDNLNMHPTVTKLGALQQSYCIKTSLHMLLWQLSILLRLVVRSPLERYPTNSWTVFMATN